MNRFARLQRLFERQTDLAAEALAAAKLAERQAAERLVNAETAVHETLALLAQTAQGGRLSVWVQAHEQLGGIAEQRERALQELREARERAEVARQQVLASWQEARKFASLAAALRAEETRQEVRAAWRAAAE